MNIQKKYTDNSAHEYHSHICYSIYISPLREETKVFKWIN